MVHDFSSRSVWRFSQYQQKDPSQDARTQMTFNTRWPGFGWHNIAIKCETDMVRRSEAWRHRTAQLRVDRSQARVAFRSAIASAL
jgi:hypothetical protein